MLLAILLTLRSSFQTSQVVPSVMWICQTPLHLCQQVKMAPAQCPGPQQGPHPGPQQIHN